MIEISRKHIWHNVQETDSSRLLLIAAFTVIGYYSGGTEGCKNTINKSKGMANLACVSV